MRRILVVLAATVAVAAAGAVPAGGITYGEADGNRHPNVGALLIEHPEHGWIQICSGTLIASDVFLTASHCTEVHDTLGWPAGVTFDPVFDAATSTVIRGEPHTNPDYYGPPMGDARSQTHDLAVVVLDEPAADVYSGIVPARLPTLDFLGSLGPRGLRNQTFTNVGYGVQEPQVGGGPPTWAWSGERRMSVSVFNALTKTHLHLSQNPARGHSGTCFGDSGGPIFFGSGAEETDLVVAITSTGEAMCRATNDTYRVDTEAARAFLAQFVTLP